MSKRLHNGYDSGSTNISTEEEEESDISSLEEEHTKDIKNYSDEVENDITNDESVKVYLPSEKLKEGEVLEFDATAYDLLQTINVEWPCLSFDIIKDNLGENRTEFPLTLYFAAGTQADQAVNNKILFIKLSNLYKTSSQDDSDDGIEYDEVEEDPILRDSFIKHPFGIINRIRVAPHKSEILSVWGDDGSVRMFNASEQIKYIESSTKRAAPFNVKPLFTFSGHPCEGFAMDWSTVKQGRFASGDCSKQVYLWEPTEDGLWSICETPFVGHESSVEDLQWSPSEPNALASCSSDKTIKIWDARQKSRCAISVRAHQCDVNVISWNKLVSYLLVSGGDDGEFKVWDLRTFGAKALPIATFKWHTDAITSVEWHPCDESVLAVSGADDQISLWDLSLEEDYEVSSPEEQSKIPAQLLFVHQGQNHIKEAHWHPQVPGLLASTAASGINVFKTINI